LTKPKDDLEAVREVAATLEEFTNEERERIFRWAREKLGMRSAASASLAGDPGITNPPSLTPAVAPSATAAAVGTRDIRSFIKEKDPKNDSQMAAVVAYYHQFVAPESQRKESITSEDLIEACRQSDRARPTRPAQTLVNAYGQGLLNRGEQGHYSLNAVGENLVAMVLPDKSGETGARRTANRRPVGKSRATSGRTTKGKKKAPSKSGRK
jgi:hypothetical protein